MIWDALYYISDILTDVYNLPNKQKPEKNTRIYDGFGVPHE